jgi:hypothetical protein
VDILRDNSFEPSDLARHLIVAMNIVIPDNHFALIPFVFLFPPTVVILIQLSEMYHAPKYYEPSLHLTDVTDCVSSLLSYVIRGP